MEDTMPQPNEEVLARNASNTSVCGECGQLAGPVRTRDGVERPQACSCSRLKNERLWPCMDFNAVVDLCRACTATPIASGSRWYPLFCRRCLALVQSQNERLAKRGYIPVGRHSLMHGIEHWGEGELNSPSAAFAAALDDFVARLHRLERFHITRIRAVVRDLASNPAPTNVVLKRARELHERSTAIAELTTALLDLGAPPIRVSIPRITCRW